MSIRVLINGANGKMGQQAVKAVTNDPDFTLVATCGRNNNLAEEIKKSKAQVVVDLTNAESVLNNIQIIIDAGVHPVIGTSGLVKDDVERLQKRCAQLKLGGIIVPNFSLGAVLLIKSAQEIAKYFPEVEIVEMHHNQKLDSPSGTAIRAAEIISDSRASTPSKLINSRETISGSRGANYQDIPIHAIRLPGFVAHLQVLFGGLGETITLRHDTIDRQCFMPGLLLACKKVMGLQNLVYGLEEIL
ncbi:MAG: 4-hydroxy-tetrahydrodipicolinate reductase [Gammaproteobacteria bacterium]